ncbi:S8 family serine peptidase [Shouchella lonarensis]|uniref:Subtilase family protein n=1 Tax=Shouchella lonarensis TaxID=1464122 RepID=A0A1G6NJ54_9BACI|nr:S8 family serine peptidase [Shouchella lonarensis]SDC67327.1 Subtilase family protein [Shouchella lonarensis]
MEATYDDALEAGISEELLLLVISHGTHVAGIIAGQAENAMLGVAPDVELYAYRVLGGFYEEEEVLTAYTANVVAGIEQSVVDGMDVINLSLGSSVNNPLTPIGIATNNAILAGVTVAIAAGNDAVVSPLFWGGESLYSIGDPAPDSLPIAVGTSSMPIDILQFENTFTYGEESFTNQVRLDPTFDNDKATKFSGQEFELVDLSEPDLDNMDIEGKVAVISVDCLETIGKPSSMPVITVLQPS